MTRNETKKKEKTLNNKIKTNIIIVIYNLYGRSGKELKTKTSRRIPHKA